MLFKGLFNISLSFLTKFAFQKQNLFLKKSRKYLIVRQAVELLLLLLVLETSAQTDSVFTMRSDSILREKSPKKTLPDTTLTAADSASVWYFFNTTDSLREGKLHFIDTTLTSFHLYDPLTKNYAMYSTLSNIGLAQESRVFLPPVYSGFLMNNLPFNKYLITNNQVKYYKQFIPFTELWYVMGEKKEQDLAVTFSRHITKVFSFGLKILMFNSPGAYLNSKSDIKSVYFTGQYYTPDKRYGVIANYLHNKLLLEENGGITNDSIFENNLETDRRVIPVNLTTAKNMIKESGFYIEQYYNLLKPEKKTNKYKRKIDAGHISYAIRYQRNQMLYTDKEPLSDFYKPYAPPLDSINTYDSVYQSLLQNQFKWSSLGYDEDKLSRFFHLYFGINYDHLENLLPHDSTKAVYDQLIPFGGIAINIRKYTYFEGQAKMVLGDYNGGDFALDAQLTQFLGSSLRNIGKFHFRLQLINRTPAWYFTKYQSNRFRWNLHLQKENLMILDGAYIYKGINAGLHLYTLTNYTYFNDSVFPTQITSTVNVVQLYVKGTLSIGKFGADGKLVYQKSGRSSLIHLPDFTGTVNLFYRTSAFKNAATFQGGLQLTYFTSYLADAYMPALRNFYLQNRTETGNYLYADAYLTLKIQRARIFLKSSNFTGYFEGWHYFNAPHYPSRDPRFSFGVSWKFFR